MPKGKKKVEQTVVVEPEVVVHYPTEKEQLEERKHELVGHLHFLDTNKFLDVGEVRRELARIELRLSQL